MILNPVVVGTKKATILFKTTAQGVLDGTSYVLNIPVKGDKSAAELLASDNLFMAITISKIPGYTGAYGAVVTTYTLANGDATISRISAQTTTSYYIAKTALEFTATNDNMISHTAYRSSVHFSGDYDVVIGLIE